MGFKALFNRKKKSKKSDSSVDSPSAIVASISGSKSPSIRLRPQVDELEQVFKKFDVNGDGKISSAELGSIMANLGHEATEDELQTMITEFDADGDGFIDLQEFVALNTQGVDTNEVMENLKDAFSVYDVDGNGSISAEELQKVMASLGEPCSMSECRKIISGVDSDGDGMIDFEEFKVMMMMGARWDSMDALKGIGR
jgi:calcium-binding protein CML